MQNPVKNLSFRWPWRPYQERVLNAIDLHLSDRKLHVVAAPGAGKTTLGLEVFRRLAKPALALSPTRSIRDQWIGRLRDFLPQNVDWPPDWVSKDLDDLQFYTSVTYQALHTRYREQQSTDEDPDDEEQTGTEALSRTEIDVLVDSFEKTGIGTLILDEAHHLHSEWWKALTRILDCVPGMTLLALTATPPYDVTGPEWKKYMELCGPIDEEISVPELVRAGTLCPHQDFVWLVEPLEKDKNAVKAYDRTVENVCDTLFEDRTLQASIEQHPWVASNQPEVVAVLDKPDIAFAMLIFLRAKELPLPRPLLAILDCEPNDLPGLSRRWWQTLIKAFLFDTSWPHTPESEKQRDRLAKSLRAKSLLWRRELRLLESRPVRKRLSMSPQKIDACIQIYRHEHKQRGDALRQVILTDFIRDHDVEKPVPDPSPPLGALPLFRALASRVHQEERRHVALHTGRVSVIHNSMLEALHKAVGNLHVSSQPLPSHEDYSRVSVNGGRLTQTFTRLLLTGKIRVLVGTRSLLGEGWDAPCINSLILASFVGSFMLTNQMRGRAIRKDKRRPNKASSIWHLAVADPDTETGLSDVEELMRRFDTFVGLGAKKPIIENGLERLSPDFLRHDNVDKRNLNIIENNNEMVKRLADISSLSRRWAAAIETGIEGRVIPSIKMEKPPSVRPFYFRKTLKYLFYQALYTFLAGTGFVAQFSRKVWYKDIKYFFWFLVIAFGVGLVVTLPKLIRAITLYLRHFPVDGSVRQIAKSVCDALCRCDMIETNRNRLRVNTMELDDGSWMVSLTGADYYERAMFSDSMAEILDPIENPRYLLTRNSEQTGAGRMDYHAVPSVLAAKKERALVLQSAWRKRVGPTELIYTRTPEGRKKLLTARARSFSTAMAAKVDRLNRWQ